MLEKIILKIFERHTVLLLANYVSDGFLAIRRDALINARMFESVPILCDYLATLDGEHEAIKPSPNETLDYENRLTACSAQVPATITSVRFLDPKNTFREGKLLRLIVASPTHPGMMACVDDELITRAGFEDGDNCVLLMRAVDAYARQDPHIGMRVASPNFDRVVTCYSHDPMSIIARQGVIVSQVQHD